MRSLWKQFLRRMRKRRVSRIVQKCCEPEELAIPLHARFAPSELSPVLHHERLEHSRCEFHNSHGMSESRMFGTRVNEMRKRQLPYVPQTLKNRSIDDLHLGFIQINETMDWIPYFLHPHN